MTDPDSKIPYSFDEIAISGESYDCLPDELNSKIFICTSERTGSFLLCRALKHYGLGIFHEYFNAMHIGIMGGRFGIPDAREVRHARLAYDEVCTGGRRGRQVGMNAQPNQAEITAVEGSALSPEELEDFTIKLVTALKTVFDPEIPVDIYELGLIYKVDVADNKDVVVDMTLTAPGCPVAGEMPGMVKDALEGVDGIGAVTVNMTFDPPWTPERMSEEAKLELNMY